MSQSLVKTDTLGFRAKIGVLVPFTNTIVQPEYESLKVRGVTNHTARIPNRPRPTHSDSAYKKAMEEGAVGTEDVIDRLTPLIPNLIILGHSIDSFAGGVDGAKTLERKLSKHAKICDVILPSLAVNAALSALGLDGGKISILTPYLRPGGEQAAEFFEDSGFKVSSLKNLSCKTAIDIASVTSKESLSYINEINSDTVDAIIQVGTNLPFQHIAIEAEKKLKKPVLSINTATYWYGLRYLGIKDKINHFGKLFASQ
ncbi:Asp/Glu racemase [Alphaproteobacteria bacterium]|nr:Asp/Glu racemase [Alphaproteobacteria bacterium]